MKINRLIFIDIETVPIHDELPDMYLPLVNDMRNRNESSYDTKLWWDMFASLYPEFSKIVCISVGYEHDGLLRCKHFDDKDGEKNLLINFFEHLSHPHFRGWDIIAHYGQNFDYPFIIKRSLLHNVSMDTRFNIVGKKPWEVKLMDSYQIYRFGGRHSAKLDTLCKFFGIKSPKESMDGALVSESYKNGELEKICEYCDDDVRALYDVTKRILQQ